jgi:hypothetical protein
MADEHQQAEDSYRPAKRGAESGDPPTPTAAGVDPNASKEHLVDGAKKVGIDRPDELEKDELVTAIEMANARASRQARKS